MKIIKRGRKQNPLLNYKITCRECGCEYRLESEKEARFVSDQRDGDFYEIKCPQCGRNGTYAATIFRPRS